MSDEQATASLIGGIALLERAINYTLGSLCVVTPGSLSHPTPCRDWDLRALLRHMDDSLEALREAIDVGHVGPGPSGDDGTIAAGPAAGPAIDPVGTVRSRARRLLEAWTSAERHHIVSVAGCPLTAGIVTGTGAVEVAVHGWDVAHACGHDRPIPRLLAEEMLDLSPLLVTDADRPARFAAPISVSPLASPGDRLVAFLGRHPN